jgi:hypothetical protein
VSKRNRRQRLSGSAAALTALALAGALSGCGSKYVPPEAVAAAAKSVPDKLDYNWDVRPILSQNCFNCHGNSTQKAGLRLDVADVAYAELPENKGKRAVTPKYPEDSELIRRITSTDADERMPPRSSHKVLSPVEIATLVKWIKDGAEYKQHWAYIKPREVKPESTEFDKQAVNPIDKYVYARLEKEQLKPAPEADKETLINRVYLTLTGLPPSLAEVDAFVADQSPGAYEKVVDKLLASSTYAERMAQTWLDVARYADTDGYLNDGGNRLLHPYRDWVISAFKRNLPYDKFVAWQVAGDQLPNATTEQVLATSFLRMGKRNAEGGITDEEWRVEYVNERTELMGSAFMGLTVACAKCHDHKYDVISQADYYAIAGFFNNMDEGGVHSKGPGGTPMGPTLPWPTQAQSERLARAHEGVKSQEVSYQVTAAKVAADAAAKASELARAPRSDIATLLAESIDAGTQAYYPLDSTFVASFEPLMIGPPTGRFSFDEDDEEGAAQLPKGPQPPGEGGIMPPREKERLASADLSKAVGRAMREGRYQFENPIAIRTRRLPVGLTEEVLAWTPSGREGELPGAVNNAKFIDGVKGKAVQLHDTIGFAAKGVGAFDRFQEFSLDLWIKLREGEPYKNSSVLYNQGQTGYDLLLEDNKLKFDMVHVAPYNMLSVRTKEALPKGKWLHVSMSYDGSSRASGVRLFVDGAQVATEVYRDRLTRTAMPRGFHSLLGSYYGLAFGTRRGQEEFIDGAIDEIRVFDKALSPIEVRYLHDPQSLDKMDSGLLGKQLVDLLAAQDERMAAAKAALRKERAAESKVESRIPQLMVARDAPVARPNYILDRGIYDKYLQEVPPGVPARVFPADQPMRKRADLVNWLFDQDNPLTARVYVNRLWQLQFGNGIVGTVQDFGTQGANPTHPELLDWLAIEFQRSGWNIAHMQKLIVMSATYRQSSQIPAELYAEDPTNKLLARGPRYRLPAEMIRDSALFASGLLVDKVGGDAVFPYQPDGVWEGNGLGANIYPTELDVTPDQFHRRSMYTYIKRNAQPASMLIFDMADRNVANVSRSISNTPLQALVLLNDPQYMEAYRKMAERAVQAAADPQAQIENVFRLATRRRPLPAEMEALTAYREAEEARLSSAKEDLDKLMAIGVAPPDPQIDRVRLASLTMVAAAAMNSPDAYTLR